MIFNKLGPMAIGSRLRMISERITDEAKNIYDLYEVPLKPKWFPVFHTLSREGEMSITMIAEEIGHTHPSVSRIVQEMARKQIVREKKDASDGRRNLITLTEYGHEIAEKMKDQYTDVDLAVRSVLDHTTHNIWKAMDEFEFLLNQNSLLERVKKEQRKRASKKVEIVPYTSEYAKEFKALNERWISKFFKMEASDYKALDHPQENIIDKGGFIFMAVFEGKAVGTCCLIKGTGSEYDFELAKMAVDPEQQGLGLGWLLGQATINKAKEMGARNVYLESNTVLETAIRLYQKLGFKKVVGLPSPYERCNIQMLLSFEDDTTDS